MKTSITDGLMIKILQTAREKGATPEHVEEMIASGALAALLDPRATFQNMPGLRHALGLQGKYLEFVGDPIFFPGENAFRVSERFKVGGSELRFTYINPTFLELFSEIEVPQTDPSVYHIASAKGGVKLSTLFKETGSTDREVHLGVISYLVQNSLLEKGTPATFCGFGDTCYHYFHARDKYGQIHTLCLYWNDGISSFGDWAICCVDEGDDTYRTGNQENRLIY